MENNFSNPEDANLPLVDAENVTEPATEETEEAKRGGFFGTLALICAILGAVPCCCANLWGLSSLVAIFFAMLSAMRTGKKLRGQTKVAFILAIISLIVNVTCVACGALMLVLMGILRTA